MSKRAGQGAQPPSKKPNVNLLNDLAESMKLRPKEDQAPQEAAQSNLNPFPDVKLTPVNPETHQRNVLENSLMEVLRIEVLNTFPGITPTILSRSHFPLIQSKTYMMCEKAEGVRYLMFICTEGAFFVDINLTFWKIDDSDNYHAQFSKNGGTLLDGELVRHGPSKKAWYLISDAIQINGTYIADRGFEERFKVLNSAFLEQLEKAVRESKSTFPFLCYKKRYYPKEGIADFWKCMKEDNNHRKYYDDGRRSHKAAGMLLIPEDPYTIGKSHTYFEWKYPDRCFLLFRIQKSATGVVAIAESDIGETECTQFHLFDPEMERLKKDWEFLLPPGTNASLAQFFYDTGHGIWRYKQLKLNALTVAGAAVTVPDDISTVCETLAALGENITKDELIHRIPKKDQESDDYLKKTGLTNW